MSSALEIRRVGRELDSYAKSREALGLFPSRRTLRGISADSPERP